MIRFLINIYIFLTILDVILSYFPQVQSYPWAKKLHKTTDFTQKPIRNILPPDLPFDFSPLIVIMVLYLIMALW